MNSEYDLDSEDVIDTEYNQHLCMVFGFVHLMFITFLHQEIRFCRGMGGN